MGVIRGQGSPWGLGFSADAQVCLTKGGAV